MKTSILIIFTKIPMPGTTKTRLIPTLGAEGAADLHQKICLDLKKVYTKRARMKEGMSVRFTEAFKLPVVGEVESESISKTETFGDSKDKKLYL